MSDKHLRIAAFVAERPEDEAWEKRMMAWNKAFPDTKFPGYRYEHKSNFTRDAIQARNRLLHPKSEDAPAESMAPTFLEDKVLEEDDDGEKAG